MGDTEDMEDTAVTVATGV
jgi:hypothetical protein